MLPDKNLLERLAAWNSRHPLSLLALLTVIVLAPFLAKPFNMDDPLFIWAGQQIQSHPGDPYGFMVNWYGLPQPMWTATQNPPLFSYYLALAAGLLGWTEIALHGACLLPAVAAVLGTYRLAQSFCRWPQFAALVTLFAPGFLVSSTSVMSDVPMLAFWIWTVVFWTEGVRQDNFWKLAAAGTLAALTVLTKYNGLCLLPLLGAFGWLAKRSLGRWVAFLLIPVAALGASEWLSFQLYGHAHFLYANQYSQANQAFHGPARLFKAFITLTFTGGAFAGALFLAPSLWRPRALFMLTAGAAFCVALALAAGLMPRQFNWLAGNLRLGVELQIFFWAVAGVSVLALALAELWQKPDPDAWLLALWVLGTCVFAAFVYWMVNVRVILPMAPAVAILVARRLAQNRAALSGGLKFALVASAALSLLAAQADFQLAAATRKSAEKICAKYAAPPGRLWFEGHWGFQYYMAGFGAWPLTVDQTEMAAGDRLVRPAQNSNLLPPDPQKTTLQEILELPDFPWFATMNTDSGAGFYSDHWGPLPFAFGSIPPETYFVYLLKPPPQNPH